MSIFSYFGCLVGRHQPLRRDVKWDGRFYSGTCRHCGAEIRRRGRHDWPKLKG